ncbi:hypothetical protein AVEN_123185-1 [Araneus ventricosus]|uniref:Uncharacterized protein n=1 Tax=Araneus ventricosus TaxID=182803 RepID=A0A4Y1ZL76_ARAVE|nr:hypothetical protein AVEN_24183-1 [Araneus ventricosus]GBL55569.1 hypothetical protein AVEN_123185-1 [Araneus ventricosus]
MEEDASVRILVELISTKKRTDTEEIIARNPTIPTYLLTEDFSKKIEDITRLRALIVLHRWHSFFDNCYRKMLSSHEMYLTFVMFVCISEQRYHQNIFDSFMSVCILVNLLNDETRAKTGVNFSHLNPDIVMVFYLNELKSIFCRRGGFQRLVEYIRSHRLVRGKCNKNNPLSPDGSTAVLKKEIPNKFKKELRVMFRNITNPDEVANDERSIYLANLVLSISSIELPTLPSYTDLIKRLVASRKHYARKIAGKKEKTETTVKFETLNVDLDACSSSISDSNTNYDAKHQENIERYEGIIQAVKRHNHSRSSSGHENANNRIQEEADGVLEHLKDTIKSLVEVLDEYDNE